MLRPKPQRLNLTQNDDLVGRVSGRRPQADAARNPPYGRKRAVDSADYACALRCAPL